MAKCFKNVALPAFKYEAMYAGSSEKSSRRVVLVRQSMHCRLSAFVNAPRDFYACV